MLNPDNFNLDKLRLSQNFSEIAGVKKVLTTVPVRKPNRQDFFRGSPGDEWSFQTAVLELKEERETYLVEKSLWSELPGEITPKILFTTINRLGTLVLWPVRLPGDDGRIDKWNGSALEAANMAQSRWIRMAANMNLGAYEIFEATGDLPEPEWPDIPFQETLKIAFQDHFIEDLNHPVVKKLRGEV